MLEAGQVMPCCCIVSVVVVHTVQIQLVEPGSFEDESHSAGRLDCTDWTLEAEAC